MTIKSTQDVVKKAIDDDVNPAIIASQYDFPVSSQELWWHPRGEDDIDDVYADNINLLAGYDDPVTKFSKTLADSLEFPESSVFLHALGVVSACMVEHFYYTIGTRENNAVGLYTVSAQPPSTGKSGVNNNLIEAAHESFELRNKENEPERRKLTRRIAKLKKKMEKVGDSEADAMEEEMIKLEEELNKIPHYEFRVTDATPEGCERKLREQNGFFNILSAESATVKVVLGTVYGDRATNNGVFLSSWDNEYISVARGGRDGFSGRARAAIAILAQDESITEILKAGLGGEGISERFLILREKSKLGYRDRKNRPDVNAKIKAEYGAMIKNIVNTRHDTHLRFSVASQNLIRDADAEYEPTMRPEGRYGSNMMRGVVGKNEKQICRLACVLHVIDNWKDGGKRSVEVQKDHVIRATLIFNQLLKTYVAAADSKGFSGKRTELNVIIEVLTKYAGKNKLTIEVRQLRDRIKNMQPFTSVEGLQKKLKGDYLPALQDTCHIVYNDNTGVIYINPRLK